MTKEEYLDIVESQIRCKMARGAVSKEIKAHIEDQAEAFRMEGMEPEDAEAAAVRGMGDPVEAGEALDRIHRPRMAWEMIALIAGLSIVGFLLQCFLKGGLEGEAISAAYFVKQLLLLLAGLGVMIGICFLDYSRIGYYAKEITVILFLLLVLGIHFFSPPVNGSLSWIYIGGISINTKLFAMLLVPLYGAILYSYRGQGYGAVLKGVFWMLPGLYIARICPSILSALILFLSFLSILGVAVYRNWFRVSRKRVLFSMGAVMVLFPLMGYGLIMRFGAVYQRDRVEAILNPETAASYQVQVIRELLDGSKLLGGFKGIRQMEVLGTSDFIMTYIISYYGILAAVLLMGLIAFLIIRFCRISLRQRNQLGMIMGTASCAVLIFQLLFYVVSNLGSNWTLLFAGGYCPFLAFGGSGMMVTCILLGLLLSIYRYQNVLPEQSREKKHRLWKIQKKAEC